MSAIPGDRTRSTARHRGRGPHRGTSGASPHGTSDRGGWHRGSRRALAHPPSLAPGLIVPLVGRRDNPMVSYGARPLHRTPRAFALTLVFGPQYNEDASPPLGDRLAVGRRALDPLAGVRILLPQPPKRRLVDPPRPAASVSTPASVPATSASRWPPTGWSV